MNTLEKRLRADAEAILRGNAASFYGGLIS